VRVIRIDRPGAKQTDLRIGCSLPAQTPTERIALRLLAERMRQHLWNLARNSLGGSYGFSGGASFHRDASAVQIEGSVDDRTLTRVLAIARKDLAELGAVQLSPDDLGLLKWRQGIASNVRLSTNDQLARGLVSMRMANLPLDFLTGYPDRLAAVTAEDVARVAAGCRQTAVLLLRGDPVLVSKALAATTR
jgi:zinc protease